MKAFLLIRCAIAAGLIACTAACLVEGPPPGPPVAAAPGPVVAAPAYYPYYNYAYPPYPYYYPSYGFSVGYIGGEHRRW
jgi:hypothetical protein